MPLNDTPRSRIEAAYDPELFQQTGAKLIELLADHLRAIESSQKSVLNWNAPVDNIAAATSMLEVTSGQQPGEKFEAIVNAMLARGHNLHDPHYVGHQVPPSIPVAGLFDAVGSILNQVMAIYEMGPWSTAVEHAVTDRLARRIGWGGTHYGAVVTHGGSLANLTGLLSARNVTLGDSWEQGITRDGAAPVLVSNGDAHYCIARSGGILGLGTKQVIKAPLDTRRRMDPDRLDELLTDLREKGHPIIAVVACACATPIGAFDPLTDIAAICAQHGVWMHVDAAHGASALYSPRYRHLVVGLDQADSLIWDAHKMLFVPALCAFLFYKDKSRSYAAFQQDAPYLFDPSAPNFADFDGGLRTVECTKRSATFGLWGIMSLFGEQLLTDLVEVTFDLGRTFYEKLQAVPDFDALHEPECNIVVFRHVPVRLREASSQVIGDFQLRLRRNIIESGKFYLVPTAFEGVAALRVTLINPLTSDADLDLLLETLREEGKKIA